jgi:hypothetical protein
MVATLSLAAGNFDGSGVDQLLVGTAAWSGTVSNGEYQRGTFVSKPVAFLLTAGQTQGSITAAASSGQDNSTTDFTVNLGSGVYVPRTVTIADAIMIQRLTDAGNSVTVHLEMEARMLPDAESANVIGEIVGREKPEEVVVIGGHIDSWDVGAGAQDDGSGIITALEAAHLIHKLGLKPRRTLRVVFWTNEENGGAGGIAYRDWVGDQIKNHVAAIEMDGGAEKPAGFGLSAHGDSPATLDKVRQIGRLLERIDAGSIQPGGGGADIAPLMRDGVPGLAVRTVGTHYFDWHHSRADTADKVKLEDLRANIAAMAVMAFILADMPETLGQSTTATR